MWAVDLNVGMTRSHIVFTLTNFLLRGNVETASGEYMVRPMASSDLPTAILPNIEVNEESKDSAAEKELSLLPPLETRSYVAIDCLYHPNLGSMQYGSFFNLCRLHGISFDLQQKLGTAFMLTDTLASGIIGLIGVGNDTNDAMKMVSCLLFVVCCCLLFGCFEKEFVCCWTLPIQRVTYRHVKSYINFYSSIFFFDFPFIHRYINH